MTDRVEQGFYGRHGKRILDLTITIALLLLLAPLMALIAILVWLRMGKPVWFCQRRPGRHGEVFTLYKFRTMTTARDARGDLLSDTERLSGFGRFLRGTSLDELPELINVLRSDMSLVGPRPLLMRYDPYFTAEERLRFEIRPGITGLAQVSGRNDICWDERIALDVTYARTFSLRQDVRILFQTAGRILSRKGFQADPGAVMLDFDEERRRRHEARHRRTRKNADAHGLDPGAGLSQGPDGDHRGGQ